MARSFDERTRRFNFEIEEDFFDGNETSSDGNSEKEKDYSITKADTGLDLYAVTPKESSSKIDIMKKIIAMNRTVAIKHEIIRLSASDIPKNNSSGTVFFKNTDCNFVCGVESIILNESNAADLVVGIRYNDKHYFLKGEDERFPVEVIFATDEETYRMFDKYEKDTDIMKAIKTYSKLTASQREFFRTQFNRPEISETKDESIYTPIKDEAALRLLYDTCKNTYSDSIRAKLKNLFSELDRHPSMSEKADLITQISLILGIDTQIFPCKQRTFDEIMTIMDKYIYGLYDFKESFAEFLLAMQATGCSDFKALLIGPPGVGKTSLGMIVSECCNKPFVYIDCSGADSVAMSGLVKSYSCAKSGKVTDGLWAIGRADSVVLLDEIDKLSFSDKGNPYSVLLKALGPQKKLYDEFVDEDIDVSSTIFIATANDINDIPGYILNRFGDNIFCLDKYSSEEKVAIAKNHIVPSALSDFKLDDNYLVISDEALEVLAREYCEDEGMREMSGYITTIIRKIFRIRSENPETGCITVDEDFVRKYIKKKKKPGIKTSHKVGF